MKKKILLITILILSLTSAVGFAENDLSPVMPQADEIVYEADEAETDEADADDADAADEAVTDAAAPDDAEDETKTTDKPAETAPIVNNTQSGLLLALETDLIMSDGTVSRSWARPFLYKGVTYAPLNVVADKLSAELVISEAEGMVRASRGWHIFAISLYSDELMTFNDIMFVPLRRMCEDLGYYVFWDQGLISISLDERSYTPEQAASYRQQLGYTGYTDKYYVPKNIVDPYVKYTYTQMLEDIDYLSKAYPDLIRVFSIGTSSEGRDIIAFDLGKGQKKVVMCASLHAREYITTNFIMYMADSYALGYETNYVSDGYDVRQLLDNVTLTIIPMVNPDGINLAQNGYDSTQKPEYLSGLNTNIYGSRGWKANANGVDLNNNFDWLWYAHGSPSFAGYSGPYAASEPETQAMQKFIMEADYEIFASLHTQGEVVYWMDPNCDQALKEKFKPHIDRICREIDFTQMPSDGTLGYSGYMTDYIRKYKQKMAMTIEICPYMGDFPYPEDDFDRVAKPVRNLGLILADICMNDL